MRQIDKDSVRNIYLGIVMLLYTGFLLVSAFIVLWGVIVALANGTWDGFPWRLFWVWLWFLLLFPYTVFKFRSWMKLKPEDMEQKS